MKHERFPSFIFFIYLFFPFLHVMYQKSSLKSHSDLQPPLTLKGDKRKPLSGEQIRLSSTDLPL